MTEKIYKNSNPLIELEGCPIYVNEFVDACLVARLNLFLQGDTGSGKTQLAKDVMDYFENKSLFILGRNDMDTRELFQQINLEKLRSGASSSEVKELTDKINYQLIVVDELPNCVPAVRAQLFNLFDGFIEIGGKAYQIGENYSVGIATGNIGQKFTESSNDLGRALKDRMHVVIDMDYFPPTPYDVLEILNENTNPRVNFNKKTKNTKDILKEYEQLITKEIPFEKLIIANYLVHGLDYCNKGSKRKMKDAWPTQLENHEQGSDVGLVLPLSVRAAKSVIRLSESLETIVSKKNVKEIDFFESMMQSYKFVSAYSGVLNEAAVMNVYGGNHYDAIDAIISTSRTQYKEKEEQIMAGLEMVKSGKKDKRVLDLFKDRWSFMKDIFNCLLEQKNVRKSN